MIDEHMELVAALRKTYSVYGSGGAAATAIESLSERAERAEAQLAKAMEALRKIASCEPKFPDDVVNIARETLKSVDVDIGESISTFAEQSTPPERNPHEVD